MDQLCALPQVFLYEGVVWSLDASGKPFIQRKLPPLHGDAVSLPLGMNDAGTVVGASGACVQPGSTVSGQHAVVWKNSVPSPLLLGPPHWGQWSSAGAINEQGQVVGIATLPGDTIVHFFFWQEGVGAKDMGTLLPDDTGGSPQSINNRGEVVGWSCGPSEMATPFQCGPFYWRNGMKQPIDLNLLTQSPHLQMCCVSDINDSGEIIGAAFDPTFNSTGDFVTVILVPQQGGAPTSESLPAESAAVHSSVLPNDVLQRLTSRLRGWKIAR